MSGRIESYNVQKGSGKWSKNESFRVREAGLDIEKDPQNCGFEGAADAVLLWEGTVTGEGSFKVPGINDYLIIGVANDVNVISIGTKSFGSGGMGTYQADSYIDFNYRFGVDPTDNETLVVNNDNRGIIRSGSGSTYSGTDWCTIKKVYGLFKKPVATQSAD